MSPRPVDDAIAVYHELGWDRLTLEQVPTADLGTPEQRRRAKAGCRSGSWAVWGQLPKGHWGMVNQLGDVDLKRFVLFAIRMGVDARRAASILDLGDIPDDALYPVVLERGPAFCTQFVDRVSTSRRRMNDWTPSKWGTVTVRLVAELELEIPDNLEYLQDWAGCAHLALTPRQPGEVATWSRLTVPPAETLTPRYAEHVRAAIAAGLQLTGPLLPACQFGLGRGLLDRDELLGLSFAGLDRARRPGERTAWVTFLVEDLGVAEAEILDRAEELLPALSTGAGEVVEKFGVPLLTKAPEELLPDLVATALPAAPSRRLRTLIVDTLRARARPDPAVVQHISDLLAGFDDKAIAPKSRVALAAAWSMGTVEPAPTPEVHAVWRSTPPVWTVPRFDSEPVTTTRLTSSVRDLVNLPSTTTAWTVEFERFLSLLVACAAEDEAATRTALRGARDAQIPLLRATAGWLRETAPAQRWGALSLASDREDAVVAGLGELPCLLSAPSLNDLRIDAADLAQRLGRYAATGVDACEPDLLLALSRTDLQTLTAELHTAITASPVGLRSPDGTHKAHRSKWWQRLGGGNKAGAAGELAQQWFSAPIPEPALVKRSGSLAWRPVRPVVPAPLQNTFGRYLASEHQRSFPFWEFPSWGDAAMVYFGYLWQTDPGQGSLIRQLVRRGSPLPPGAAINLLAAQRDPHPLAAAEIQQAVLDAFERGILRPGDADVRYLDWSDTPRNLAAFGRAMRELAEAGLATVVWPVLDDLIAVSAAAPTVITGTEVLAETMAALLPSAQAAVEAGIIDASAFALPGLRQLAARTGSGRAVRAAREVIDALPVAEDDGISTPASLDRRE